MALLNGTATFAWTPGFSQSGNYTNVTITVTDNGTPAQSASQSFTITVGNVNRPPVLGAIGNKTVNEGQLLSIPLSASDPDGDAPAFAGSNIPAGATFTDNHDGTAALSWTPASGQAGSYANVTVTVTDNGSPALSDAEIFAITVQRSVTTAPPPSVTALTIKNVKLSCKNYMLYVQGYVRPGGTTVMIINGSSKNTLGTVRANRAGAWKALLRMQRGSMPSSVQATAGGLSSSLKTVPGGSCSQSQESDD